MYAKKIKLKYRIEVMSYLRLQIKIIKNNRIIALFNESLARVLFGIDFRFVGKQGSVRINI